MVSESHLHSVLKGSLLQNGQVKKNFFFLKKKSPGKILSTVFVLNIVKVQVVREGSGAWLPFIREGEGMRASEKVTLKEKAPDDSEENFPKIALEQKYQRLPLLNRLFWPSFGSLLLVELEADAVSASSPTAHGLLGFPSLPGCRQHPKSPIFFGWEDRRPLPPLCTILCPKEITWTIRRQ